MKKRNVKSLKLHKSSVSNLSNENVKGGANSFLKCPTLQNPPCTSFIDACPSAWVCPTDVPTLCVLP